MSIEYFNQRADTWDDRVAEKDTAKLRSLIDRMGLWNGATVLDVGTGTGILLPLILEAVGPVGDVCGLDFSQLMLLQARQKPGLERARYVLGDATCLPVNPQRFDFVVCYSSFPHFSDKHEALSEMYRVLKPGGRLIICHSSNRNDINNRHRKMTEVANHLLPSEEQLSNMLKAAGFKEITVEDGTASYLAAAKRSEF